MRQLSDTPVVFRSGESIGAGRYKSPLIRVGVGDWEDGGEFDAELDEEDVIGALGCLNEDGHG